MPCARARRRAHRGRAARQLRGRHRPAAVAARRRAALQGAASPPLPAAPPTRRSSASARVRTMSSAPPSPTSSSGRMVKLWARSTAGKRRAAVRPASSDDRRGLATQGSATVAITVSEPPSTIRRAAAMALRATLGATPTSESMMTTTWLPRAARRRAWSSTRSTACPCASPDAPSGRTPQRRAGPRPTR